MSDEPAFRAMLERAGKAWSHRIADTWTPWERFPGDLKGWLARGDPSATRTEVRVGPEGEVSTGLEIDVRYEDFTIGASGLGGGGIPPPGDSWEPHFGTIVIDKEHLEKYHGTSRLLFVLTHEMGHVLGAWTPWTTHPSYPEHLRAYVDETTGAWTGPNVVALHGGPAPFQDASDTHAWVNGERDPNATDYDFAHSGVCASLMAYCSSQAALRGFLPDAIDFAFLKDIGMTIIEETERPETYGLAGWTDYAAFTVSVSRDLQIALADPQPHYGYHGGPWQTLDVVDLLQAEVDAFGYLSTRSFRSSYTAKGPDGTVHYTGGLLGAALDRMGLPPVTGDATLSVYLATLDGAASFTSLTVYPDGTPEIFADGSLHYPIELSANAIAGTGPGVTFQADFYGPNHEDVAGVLHDPQAGLLASFGATVDERSFREGVIASADYSVQPDTLTLEESGTIRALISTEGYDFYAYDKWGFWAKQFQETIFGAFLEQEVIEYGYYTPYGRIEGTPSGRDPVSGSAVWSGKVRAVETKPRGYTPVSGKARLEVDIGDATIDIDFTEFGEGHSDMSWRALQLEQGAFRDPQVGQTTIEGAFYGTDHQGVAGTFERNRLRGVFGGLRTN